MISKEKKYTACPKCYGNMRLKRNGSYKCRLCKREFTRKEYIESIASMLVDDIKLFNQVTESQVRANTFRKWLESRDQIYQ